MLACLDIYYRQFSMGFVFTMIIAMKSAVISFIAVQICILIKILYFLNEV